MRNAKKLVTVLGKKGPPKSAPTAAMGWREYWNAMDATKLFTDAGTTPVSADGEAVYQMNGNLGVVANSYFQQATEESRPLYKTGGAGGKPYLLFDGTNDFMASLAISNFLANNAKTVVFVASINTGYTNGDRPYFDSSGWFGSTIAAGSKINTYNYDTSAKLTAGQTFVVDTPFIYIAKHDAGNLYDAINGGVWSDAVASANTGALTGLMRIGPSNTLYPPMSVYAFALSNVVISDANLTLCINYFKAQLGIS